MPASENTLIYWTVSAAGLAYALLAMHLLRQGWVHMATSRTALVMLLAALCSVLWSLFSLLALTSHPVWALAAQSADVWRYLCWGGFVVGLLHADRVRSVSARWWWALAGTGVLVVPALLVLGQQVGGAMAGIFLMALLALVTLIAVEQLFRNLPEGSVWSTKPVCLGLAGMAVFDLYLFSQGVLFRGLDSEVWSVRPLVHAAMVPLLLLASARHRNWVSRVQVSRQVVFHSATLVLVGVYLLFIAGVGYYVQFFGADWGRALQVGLVFVALVLALALALSGALRAKLRVWLGKHFFRYRFDYREEWLKFTATLSGAAQPSEAGQSVVRGLADMLESPAGALWQLRPDDDQYRQTARWNVAAAPCTEDQDGSLATFMRSTGWVVNVQELRAYPRRYLQLQLPQWLASDPQAWLVVPLWQGQGLLGFVVLARPRTPVEVNWEVNDLLKTAGRQAASFLAQIQATDALLEARKFEAFSRMSAFVVHDLKNIVTQLSLMVKNAKRLQDNPEFQADMLMTVENALERMRQLMLQLRENTTPGNTSVGVNLGRVAERLASDARSRGRALQLQVSPHVFTRGQAERVERIIGHLVHNALDATDVQGDVWLKVDRFASHARVEVGDSGQGMTEEFVQTRLFKPFQTTKAAGMGIGTYESFQYVQELGGKLSVDSQVGKGTVVRILLPLFEVFHDAEQLQEGRP